VVEQRPFKPSLSLAACRTKTQANEIAFVCKGSPRSHDAMPRSETHQIANPTDTTTDTSDRAKLTLTVGSIAEAPARSSTGWVIPILSHSPRPPERTRTLLGRTRVAHLRREETRLRDYRGRVTIPFYRPGRKGTRSWARKFFRTADFFSLAVSLGKYLVPIGTQSSVARLLPPIQAKKQIAAGGFLSKLVNQSSLKRWSATNFKIWTAPAQMRAFLLRFGQRLWPARAVSPRWWVPCMRHSHRTVFLQQRSLIWASRDQNGSKPNKHIGHPVESCLWTKPPSRLSLIAKRRFPSWEILTDTGTARNS